MMDKYQDKALAKGVKLIPMCGFDSLPSDVGTLMVASALRDKHGIQVGGPCGTYLWYH